MKKIGAVISLLAAAIAGFGFYRTFTPPADLWTATHRFPGCPDRPSCVSSIARDDVHAVAAIHYDGTPEQAIAVLADVVAGMPGARIEHEDAHYLHAIFVTPLMHYRDDVELLVSPDSTIDVRSISRFGYGDHGVNRARVEQIRARFDAAGAAAAGAAAVP